MLTVTARPGQESADLGALLYTFRRLGTSLALLSLTRGEASQLNSTYERLEKIRPPEMQVAAQLLGIGSVAVADYPDGRLSSCPVAMLTERVRRAIREQDADLLLVTDPADSGTDEAVVAMAACSAAEQAGVPTVARTASAARGGWQVDLGDGAVDARAAQRSAVAAHASQSDGLPEQIWRLDQLGRKEWLRWLVPPPSVRLLLNLYSRRSARVATSGTTAEDRCSVFRTLAVRQGLRRARPERVAKAPAGSAPSRSSQLITVDSSRPSASAQLPVTHDLHAKGVRSSRRPAYLLTIPGQRPRGSGHRH